MCVLGSVLVLVCVCVYVWVGVFVRVSQAKQRKQHTHIYTHTGAYTHNRWLAHTVKQIICKKQIYVYVDNIFKDYNATTNDDK